MIILHSHLLAQFKNELFHILHIISLLTGDMNSIKLTSLPMCGFIAQLIEQRTVNAEVTGSNPVEFLIFFFQASSFQLLKLKNLLRWSFFTFKKVSLFDFYRRIWVRLNYMILLLLFFWSTRKSCLQVINIHGIGRNLDKWRRNTSFQNSRFKFLHQNHW